MCVLRRQLRLADPPSPCSECTVTADPPARLPASRRSSASRPVKCGLCGGALHTRGGAPGNRGTAAAPGRPASGKPGLAAGFARPATAAATSDSNRLRAPASPSPNRSNPVTPPSSPGRAHLRTRTGSSFRCAPAGSAAHAARHSASP